ncbi:unnamed protein product, partial [Scytosiphon promiscuus]
CPETGGALKAGGPIWSGPLHDEDWARGGVQETGALTPRPRLAVGARVESLLRSVSGELPGVPLFYNLRDMFATL